MAAVPLYVAKLARDWSTLHPQILLPSNLDLTVLFRQIPLEVSVAPMCWVAEFQADFCDCRSM